jgi:serine palmitoyltransferase
MRHAPASPGPACSSAQVLVDTNGNGKGVLIISDTLNHSSIVEGVRGSGARVQPFAHNDMAQLEAVLQHATECGQPNGQPWRKIIIIVEGIYSMEGQFCRLREVVALKKKYRAYLYLDEAHSIGAVGPRGRGVTDHLGVPTADVDIMMGTFTKSFGSVGGYVAGSKQMVAALRRHAAGSLYAPAMSPPAAQQALSALRVIMGSDPATGDLGQRKIAQLRENSNMFRKGLLAMGCRVLGDIDSPIIPIMLYHPEKISGFSRNCLKRAMAVVVVGFPATPLLLSRSRFCIAASHTRDELELALGLIEEAAAETGVLYDRSAAKAGLLAGEDLDETAVLRKAELHGAPLEVPGPMTSWVPEPLIAPEKEGETGHEEAYAQAVADAAHPVCADVDLRRTDFLQMNVDKQTLAAAEAALYKYGCGTCGPRGFYGTLDVHIQLEKALAVFLRTEKAIIYSFGIATISSVVPAFVRKGDLLFVDDGIHFTGAVGTRLARGGVRPFAHNDVAALEAALQAQARADANRAAFKVARRFVLVEGLYGSSGDIAPLPAILALRAKYGFYLIVDDTLGFGALGATGRGTPELLGIPTSEIDLYVGSLEHALGSVGGFCAGTAPMVSHQVLSGSGYCFSASLPAYATCAALEALRVIDARPERNRNLAAAATAMSAALQTGVGSVAHVELLSDAASPIAHVRLSSLARGTLSLAQQETILRHAASAVAAAPDQVAMQLVRHSAQSHIQAQQPPSLRLSIHSGARLAALGPAAALLGAELEASLSSGSIAAQLAAVAHAVKPPLATVFSTQADDTSSGSSSDELVNTDSDELEHQARTLDERPVKGNVSVALESDVPAVTVPILLGVDVLRQVFRRYIQRQMELHELTLLPPLHKLRNAGLASPLARKLFTCGQLLGAETFYFFIIPMLSWSASPNAHPPMFVTFFAVNIYVGNWLKNFFALARPSGAAGSDTAHSTSDFGWPSMYLLNAVAVPFFAMRYWYGGFGSGTPYSEQNQLATFVSYVLAFLWVAVIAFARLFSGASSPADVQGGMLVGGVLVRVWLPICDSVNDWIVGDDSYLLGLPQWAALLAGAALLLAVHPFTVSERRSWSAFGYSFKAIAFGTAFVIGANGAAIWGVNDYFLAPTSPTLTKAFTLQLGLTDTARLLARNLLGFATLLALWHTSKFGSQLLEARLLRSTPMPKGVLPNLMRHAVTFSTMGLATSLGLPLAFRALQI